VSGLPGRLTCHDNIFMNRLSAANQVRFESAARSVCVCVCNFRYLFELIPIPLVAVTGIHCYFQCVIVGKFLDSNFHVELCCG